MSVPRPQFHRSATLKLLVIGFLALLMAIPLSMLDGLRHERQERRSEAEQALATSYGDAQWVGAPLLRVPVEVRETRRDGVIVPRRYWRYQMPDRVDADAVLSVERRRRGIFELPVYQAEVTLAVTFAHPREMFAAGDGDVQWALAELVFGVVDPRGLRRIEPLFGNIPAARIESLGEGPGGMAMFRLASLSLDGAETPIAGQLKLGLAGSRRFDWLPLARDYRAHLRAPWPDPNFSGAFSPTRSRVSADASEASWQVLEFNRNLPAVFASGDIDGIRMDRHAFGVALYEPGDVYQRNERTLKYGLLVIALSFGVFFLFETLSTLRLHPVQYLLVGVALATFFLVLLAASEHLRFGLAYLLAAIALIAMIAGYAGAVLRKPRHGGVIALWLALLYATLYVLVGAEDYALLAGSGLVLALIGATMYLTRRIDWYAFGAPVPPELPIPAEHVS
ncbi:MAG: cell envelope integrity protein CreD [Rhodanobacteraceae bacterium]|nr:cell envelope integrity protein CreD [Rhodanobacteraceae bacterium]MBP9153379.1 cell envelope integrity protein CreD [Xanthomonadales bacterium]HQW81209.1 cell envelope integrity protein CreD [Pseudomonadota bacterium]